MGKKREKILFKFIIIATCVSLITYINGFLETKSSMQETVTSSKVSSTENAYAYTVKSNRDVEFSDSNQVFWYLSENAVDDEMKQALIDHGCDKGRINEIIAKGTLRMTYYDFITNHNMELSLGKSQYEFLNMYNKYGAEWMNRYKCLNGYDVD